MSDTTPRLGLPLIAAGQADKETFHNEALARLDATVLGAVQDVGLATPPDGAVAGQCWIVGTSPGGEWAGQALSLACLTEGGWRFVAAASGMAVRRADSGAEVRFDGTGWRTGEILASRVFVGGVGVVGAQQPAIIAPAGGTVVDSEARTALSAVLTALATHGLIAP